MRAWIGEEAARVSDGFVIEANGARIPLVLREASATTRPGAGGLPTLYWTGNYTAAIPTHASVTIEDSVYADRRVGWRDIVLPGTPDPTNALRSYPNALIGSPRHNDRRYVRRAFRRRIARAKVAGGTADTWSASSIVRSSAFSDLFARSDRTPSWCAHYSGRVWFGRLHGLEPGHGKALLAFTLVGARATFKQAVILAGALTFAHTIAVFARDCCSFSSRICDRVASLHGSRSFPDFAVVAIGLAALRHYPALSARPQRTRACTTRITRLRSRSPSSHMPARDDHGHAHVDSGFQTPLHFSSAVVGRDERRHRAVSGGNRRVAWPRSICIGRLRSVLSLFSASDWRQYSVGSGSPSFTARMASATQRLCVVLLMPPP